MWCVYESKCGFLPHFAEQELSDSEKELQLKFNQILKDFLFS